MRSVRPLLALLPLVLLACGDDASSTTAGAAGSSTGTAGASAGSAGAAGSSSGSGGAAAGGGGGGGGAAGDVIDTMLCQSFAGAAATLTGAASADAAPTAELELGKAYLVTGGAKTWVSFTLPGPHNNLALAFSKGEAFTSLSLQGAAVAVEPPAANPACSGALQEIRVHVHLAGTYVLELAPADGVTVEVLKY